MKKQKFLILMAATFMMAIVGLTSCTDESTVVLSGKVLNYTDNGVKSATVELLSGSIVVASTTSSVDGSYDLKVKEGTYQLRVSATGYNDNSQEIDLTADMEKNVVLLGSATVTGRVVNSQTGLGVPNAEVRLNRDLGDKSLVSYEIVVFTNNFGYFTIQYCPVGTLVGVIIIDNFLPRDVVWVVTSGTNNAGDETVVSPPSEGQLRIVLTWGEEPWDLDSHLTGPDGSSDGRFHVCYWNKVVGGAELDVDDVSSYGPETITISQFNNGLYRYSVHNYSNQSYDGGLGIYTSPARVEVYDHTGLRYTFTAPPFTTGTGNTWRVFEFTVNNGVIAQFTQVNSYVYANSSSDVGAFKSNDKKKAPFSGKDF